MFFGGIVETFLRYHEGCADGHCRGNGQAKADVLVFESVEHDDRWEREPAAPLTVDAHKAEVECFQKD